MSQALEQFLSLHYHKLRGAGKEVLKDSLKCYQIFPLEKQEPTMSMSEGRGLFHISQLDQKPSECSSGLQLFCLLHTLEEFPQYPSEMLFLLSGCYLEIMTKQENFTGKTHFFLSGYLVQSNSHLGFLERFQTACYFSTLKSFAALEVSFILQDGAKW